MITSTYTLLALAYLALQHRSDRWLVVLKPLPILLLAYWAWTDATDGWLIAALLLSAAGDIALGIDSERYFVQGLGFFLLAHVAYVVIFGRNMAFTTQALIPISIVFVVALMLIPRLQPRLGSLQFPVLIYIAIIVLMGITAALHTPFSVVLAAGAIVFMLSDATIAVNKFLQPVPARDFIVMTTYYLAQFMMVVSLVKGLS